MEDSGEEGKAGIDDSDDGLETCDEGYDGILFGVVVEVVISGHEDAG